MQWETIPDQWIWLSAAAVFVVFVATIAARSLRKPKPHDKTKSNAAAQNGWTATGRIDFVDPAPARFCQPPLQRHLQIPTFQAAEFLGAVNPRRVALGLPNIEKLTADTKLDAGLAESGKTPEFNKQSVLRDLKALSDASGTFPDLGKADVTLILSGVARLEADSALLDALQRRWLRGSIWSMARSARFVITCGRTSKNFVTKDFEPVVGAFKELLNCFRCTSCQSWLYVTPRGPNPESLRCHCSAFNMNLKVKPK